MNNQNNEITETNHLIEIQKLMLKQMHRLDEGCAKSEIQLEVGRSGALSQNAQAYLKSLAIGIKVKEMTKHNPQAEKTILKEIGAMDEN